jgi:uncharacterized Zn finger protein
VSWTVEQVLGLAPDAWAARAARDLAMARKWRAAATNVEHGAVWGEYQGSGSQPYATAVDLAGPGFKCSCPSRKSPCKHALGLMLLAASGDAPLPAAEPPDWLSDWLRSRRGRLEPRAVAADDERTADEQRKRASRREERITEGVEDLDRWLQDVLRAGLAEVATRPWSTFDQMSARLVDAQAPGLARLVRHLGGLPHTTSNWPERMLIDVGRLALLLDAWRRRTHLDPRQQDEVRTLVGINEPREAVLSRPPVHDTWDVLGRRVLESERMRVQRTWLWGQQTQRWALLLDFSVAGQPIEQLVTPGLSFEADVYFYAGALPLRGIVGPSPCRVGAPKLLPARDIDRAMDGYASMLGQNPWLERGPITVRQVVPRATRDDAWWLTDTEGCALRFDADAGWQVMALSGGARVDVLGEWDGFTLVPLSVFAEGRLVQLSARLGP